MPLGRLFLFWALALAFARTRASGVPGSSGTGVRDGLTSRSCNGDSDPLKESLGCLRGWTGDLSPSVGLREAAAARSYGGEIIVFMAFHGASATNSRRHGRTGTLVEDVAAMVLNLQALRIEHYLLLVDQPELCDSVTQTLRTATVLGPEEVISCGWFGIQEGQLEVLPGVPWEGLCWHGHEDDILFPCIQFERFLLARELKAAGLNVLVIDLDIAITANPYMAFSDPAFRRHSGLVMGSQNCGIMYFGGCAGASETSGLWVLNHLRDLLVSALSQVAVPEKQASDASFDGAPVPSQGPFSVNGTEYLKLWDQALIIDLVRRAIDGQELWCNSPPSGRFFREIGSSDEERERQHQACWDVDSVREEAWPQVGVEESYVELVAGGAVAGAYGQVVLDRVQQSLDALREKKDGHFKAYRSLVGDVCADGERESIMLQADWLMAHAGGLDGDAGLLVHFVAMDLYPQYSCSKLLAPKAAGWRGPDTVVPGLLVPERPKLLALGSGWRLPHSSFELWLAEAQTLLEIAAATGRLAVLPSAPCSGFLPPEDGAAIHAAARGCTHGWMPVRPPVPGTDQKVTRFVASCSTGVASEQHCELTTPCQCQVGGKAALVYASDLNAVLANVNNRFGEVTEARHVLDTDSLSGRLGGLKTGLTLADVKATLERYGDASVLYLDPKHERSGLPSLLNMTRTVKCLPHKAWF